MFFCLSFIHQNGFLCPRMFLSETDLPNRVQKSEADAHVSLRRNISRYSMSLCPLFIYQNPCPSEPCFCLSHDCHIKFKIQRRTLMFVCAERSLNTLSYSVQPSIYQNLSLYNACFWSPKYTTLAPCFSASKYQAILYLILSAFYISRSLTIQQMFACLCEIKTSLYE